MKSRITFPDMVNFLETGHVAEHGSVTPVREGRISQAVRFRRGSEELICRVAPDQTMFQGDLIASELGLDVPVPPVCGIGIWNDVGWCISEFRPGTSGDQFSLAEFSGFRDNVLASLADIYHTDVSSILGYGPLSPARRGQFDTFGQALDAMVGRFPESLLSADLSTLGMPPEIASRLHGVVERCRHNLHSQRRLLHGDPGFDNILILDGEVTAHIDWAQISLGDWVQDFVRLETWDSARYGTTEAFARRFDLDHAGLDERRFLYSALNMMDAIHFAVVYENAGTAAWLRADCERLLGEWT